VDPQGIWMLDETRWHRFPSELSDNYVDLARGRRTASDLPAHFFTPENARDLAGYVKLMSGWPDWREQRMLDAA
jgi:hypothetical protein